MKEKSRSITHGVVGYSGRVTVTGCLGSFNTTFYSLAKKKTFLIYTIYIYIYLVPGTLALDLPTLISDVWFFCLTVCDHRICISLRTMKNQKDTGGTAEVVE